MSESISEYNVYSDFQYAPSNAGGVIEPQVKEEDASQLSLNYGLNAYNYPTPQVGGLEMSVSQYPGQFQLHGSVDEYSRKTYFNEQIMFNSDEVNAYQDSKELYGGCNEFENTFNYSNPFNAKDSSLFTYTSTVDTPMINTNYRYLGAQFDTESEPASVTSTNSISYTIEKPIEQNFTSFNLHQIPNYAFHPEQEPIKIEEQSNMIPPAEGMSVMKRYKVVRGVSAGGCSTRPPKESIESNSVYLPVELELNEASVKSICYPKWSDSEIEDKRRIARIERIQSGPKLIANFSILGAAKDNMVTASSPSNVDVVEVSCLRCLVNLNDDIDSSDDESRGSGGYSSGYNGSSEAYNYYITSVEVLGIVELLIGTQSNDPAERRREKGRIRSNLVPFWSKKPISSRMSDSSSPSPSSPSNQDYRVELAKRIMGYEIRKPRGFDKEVRILRWDKLVPALKRALQSYYTEIPQSDGNLEFN